MACYRFFVHRRHDAFRLVVRDDQPFPDEGTEADWLQTRVRERDDVNVSIRDEVDRSGYSIFKVGFAFSDIPPT